ncbi:MAG: oxidoreductase [Alteromonas sp. Nap_26]|nr:MAG: oxidoreductase [Alteromonas sp. Nap_26]
MTYDPLISQRVSPSLPSPNTYWHATHNCVTPPALSQNCKTEYLIIGGGYTGLSAAITLAEAGEQVVLIDANKLGFGCAGRNGGFVLSGSGRLSLSAIEEKWGLSTAKAMQAEYEGAVSLLTSRIQHYAMRVDYTEGPYYKLAHTPKQAKTLQAAALHQQNQFNVPSTAFNKEDIQQRFSINNVYGGVRVDGACLHPLKLADEYARIARSLDASLYFNTPALSIDKKANGYAVNTPNGEIKAKHILIASNAYTPKRFENMVDKKQFPVQSSIFVTAPLSEQLRSATGLNSPMSFMDTRMMKYYYRVLPDGRLLFGGRGAVAGKNDDNLKEKNRLYQAMIKSFPALNGTKMEYFWSGWVSVSLDDLPRIFVDGDDNHKMGYAMGYCGSGVSFAAHAGMRLAQRMLNTGNIDLSLPLFQTPLPTYPFSSFRRMALHGLYQWAKIAER